MQFTWRTERIRGLVFPGDGEAGSWVAAALLSIIPKQFEAHTGFTPGMMLGPLSREPSSGNFLVKHRFSCTYDLGVRLIIPIWRFNLYGDFTYHCYLTDNFGFAFLHGAGRWPVVQFLSLFAAGIPEIHAVRNKTACVIPYFSNKVCIFAWAYLIASND